MSHLFNLEGPLFKVFTRVVDIVILNLLFLIFSIPLITIGASMTALYSVMIKVVRDEDKNIVKSFVFAFKSNFIKATVVWFIMLASGILLVVDFNLLSQLRGVPKIFFASVLLVFGVVYLCILLFIFPYKARYEDTLIKTLLNSLLIGFSNFSYLILLFLFNIIPIIFVFSSTIGMITGLYFVTFGGVALLVFINSYIFRRIFSKYEVSG